MQYVRTLVQLIMLHLHKEFTYVYLQQCKRVLFALLDFHTVFCRGLGRTIIIITVIIVTVIIAILLVVVIVIIGLLSFLFLN